MKKCIIFYEYWQMKCCGKEFSVNSKIKWFVCNGRKIKFPFKTERIDYYYDAHDFDDKKHFVLEGDIKEIKAVYQKYESPSQNAEVLVALDGILYDIKSSRHVVDRKNKMDFSGYLVYVENFSIHSTTKKDIN